jgi:DNA-binding Lrp family transcriptional regulator
MKTTTDLFQESIEQYKNLIDQTNSLASKMAGLSPEEILQHCEELQELQQKQAVIDKFILEVMVDNGPQVLDTQNIGEYQRVMNKAIHSCDKVASKAKTIRTLLQSEIQRLKKGQKGLAGYAAVNEGTQPNMQGRV